jgi:serine/threonine protein kinase
MKRGSRRTRRGGVVIGQGGFGIVYMKDDPIKELLPNGCEWKDGYVMKVATDATSEWKKTQSLRDKNIQGSIYPEYTCPLKDGRNALFSPYGGQSLLELFYSEVPITTDTLLKLAKTNAAFYRGNAVVVRNHEMIPRVLAALRILIGHVKTMNAQGISHNDIHEGNIVFDGNVARLIDFGNMTFREDDRKEEYFELEGILDNLTKNQKAGSRKRVGTSRRRTQRRRSYR